MSRFFFLPITYSFLYIHLYVFRIFTVVLKSISQIFFFLIGCTYIYIGLIHSHHNYQHISMSICFINVFYTWAKVVTTTKYARCVRFSRTVTVTKTFHVTGNFALIHRNTRVLIRYSVFSEIKHN